MTDQLFYTLLCVCGVPVSLTLTAFGLFVVLPAMVTKFFDWID